MVSRYTVKQVAALTGVTPATLRAWERRYTVVEPERTASKYRLYDDADVARLTRMAELVAGGTPASLAAEEVTRESPLAAEAAEAPRREPSEPPSTSALADAAQTLDPVVLDRVLDEAFASGSFEYVVDRWLMPSLAEVGAAWSDGRVDVAGEHFVSAAVHRRLAQSFEAAGGREGAPVVVVGLPPGAFHQLAVLAFSTALRRQGLDVRYLGADVPTESWTRTARQLRPQAVVVAVPTAADAAPATEVVRALGNASDVLLGGGAAGRVDADGVTLLEGSVVESARVVSERLHAR